MCWWLSRARRCAGVAFGLVGLSAVCAWPDQDVELVRNNAHQTRRGAEMLANMGFAGLGYCPVAFVTQPNEQDRTLFEWIFEPDEPQDSVLRASATLEAFEQAGASFFAGEFPPTSPVYTVSNLVKESIKSQFLPLKRSFEKINFCLTALLAIASGHPVVAGKRMHCPEPPEPCTVHIGQPDRATNVVHAGATGLMDLDVYLSPSQGVIWPRGAAAMPRMSDARVVWSEHWGLQAIVARAMVPVVYAANKMEMRDGLVVAFRGTSAYHHASNIGLSATKIHCMGDKCCGSTTLGCKLTETRPGKAFVDHKDTNPSSINHQAGGHQWLMNLKADLSDWLSRELLRVEDSYPLHKSPRITDFATHEGISYEAAHIVGFPPEVDWGFSSDEKEKLEVPVINGRGIGTKSKGGVCRAVLALTNGGQAAVPILVTGHSKGGALSIIGSYLLQKCLSRRDAAPRVTTVVSVEGPRTGDEAWVKEFYGFLADEAKALDARFNVYRVVKRGDPVPEAPTPGGGMRHVPGLLMVPVLTVLDRSAGGVTLPTVWTCDLTLVMQFCLDWDLARSQRGEPDTDNVRSQIIMAGNAQDRFNLFKAHGGPCKDQLWDSKVPADFIIGGYSPTKCTRCVAPPHSPSQKQIDQGFTGCLETDSSIRE
jgi:hypothetical protein